MIASKTTLAGWLMVAAVALGPAAAVRAQERGQRTDVSGVLKSVDGGAGTITVAVSVDQPRDGERRDPATTDKTFSLAKNVEVVAGNGGTGGRGDWRGAGLFREVKLADLAPGVRVSLTMSSDQKTVEGIAAEGPTVRGKLNAVDATKNTVTILFAPASRGRDGTVEEAKETTYALTPDAEIAVDDGRGGRFSVKQAKLADLATGSLVTARLFVDMKGIQGIFAEGPSYRGTIKALDPAKGTLTLVGGQNRGDSSEELSLVLAGDAMVLLDDGKGRRLSIKQGKLGDVPVGAAATVKMSVDQTHVMNILAEGITLTGQLKGVDAAKGTIVIAIAKGRGEDPEEKTLTVAKDARISIDGNDSKLADLKVGENPTVSLRLSLDGTNVQAIGHRQAGSRR